MIILTAVLVGTLSLTAGPPPVHPRLWITKDDLPRLRSLAKDSQRNALGWVPAEACAKILQRAEQLAQAPPYHYAVEIPGREGGPSKHWEYTLSDQPPPRHDDSRHYPPWTAMFQERSDSITTRIKYFIFAYELTGDKKYFEKAKEIVFHLCHWPIVWTDPSYGSGKPCLDTGHAAHAVGLFYDWCWHDLTPSERKFVRQALVDKALKPIDDILDKIADYHNYSAVITMGLGTGAVALLGEEPEADRWLERCLAKVKRSFDAQGRDGGPLEGPMYGTYFADSYARLLWGLHTAGVATDIWQHPFLRTLPRYCLGMMVPRVHRLPTFGDGGLTNAFPLTMMLLALRGDSDAAWYLQQLGALEPGSLETLLLLDPAKIKPRKPSWNPSCCFWDVGYASLRDAFNEDAAYMAFKCGPPEKVVGHNHYDHNSFQLIYNGAVLASDPGYRSYFNPPARKYTSSTLGHNTVVLNLTPEWLASSSFATAGVDQVRLDGGRIVRYFTSAAYDYLRGDATQTYNPKDRQILQRAWRDVLFIKPRVFVVRDQLAATKPATFHWLLHTLAGQPLSVTTDGGLQIRATSAELQGRVFSPQGLRMSRGEYKGAEAYGPYAMATTPRLREATIVTVLVPSKWTGLVNGDFERGLGGWQIRNMPGYTENHVLDKQVVHSGKASARIDAPGGYYYSTRFFAAPGTRLRASFWARLEGTEGGATTCFYFWRGGKSFARAEGPRPRGSAWKRYEFEATVPKNTDSICLALNFFSKTGHAWFDDVTLTMTPSATESGLRQVRALRGGEDGVVVEMEGTHVVLFGHGHGLERMSAAGHGLQWAGEACAVSFDAEGKPVRAWLLEGTKVLVDGREIIKLPAVGTAGAVLAGTQWQVSAVDDLRPALMAQVEKQAD